VAQLIYTNLGTKFIPILLLKKKISIQNFFIFSLKKKKFSGKEHCFSVGFPGDEGRLLLASSAPEKTAWLRDLSFLINAAKKLHNLNQNKILSSHSENSTHSQENSLETSSSSSASFSILGEESEIVKLCQNCGTEKRKVGRKIQKKK
jgi:hypothetical protein